MTATEAPAGDEFSLQEYYTPGQRRLRRFPALARLSFEMVVAAAGRELFEIVAMQAVSAIALAVQLLLLKSLLAHLVGHHGPLSLSTVLPQLLGLGGLTLLSGTLTSVLGLRSRLLSQLVAKHAIDTVIRRATRVELITYDRPAFYDQLQRAQLAAAYRPAMMVQELIGSAGALLSIGAIAVTLLILQPLFCLLILIAYIPVWFTTNRAGRLGYRQTVEQTERERKRAYLFEILTTKQPAQEIRAFGIGGFLADRQDGIYASLLEELRTVLRRRMRLALVGQTLAALLSAVALATLVWFVTTGRMSLATAGSAAGAMVLLSGRLHAVASGSAGLYENSLYLEDYINFVMPDADGGRTGTDTRSAQTPDETAPTALEVERVGFTYPSRSEPSLTGVSLSLRRGEVVALVGENGSGKTTLAKLLAGLYVPSAGAIRGGDGAAKPLDPGAIHRHVAVVFQDFMRYLLPAHDNIALGDHRRFGDREAVRRAAQAAGIDEAITALPRGYETILGPAYYGGSDLSGGQWQRVALARLFFRDAPFVILDEPTSALDPRAEAALYESMRSLFADRGVLLISHRFASARTADHIYVLRDGSVYEHGTHAELIAAGGYYAELFELQARHYRD